MSEPTPPGVPAPAPPEHPDTSPDRPGASPENEPPVEVKRATTLYTATAAFLVFIGVTSLFLLNDTERELRKQLNDLSADQTAVLDQPGLIRGMLIFLAVAVLIVAIGHGITSQALRDRKSWARPVGFTFSGILAGVAVLGTLGGAISIQTIFYLVAGLSGILALAKPQVRDYLQPFPKARPYVPGPFPPGPPNNGSWPPPEQNPADRRPDDPTS